jgi:uncharacterized damage-inducible protein DinB
MALRPAIQRQLFILQAGTDDLFTYLESLPEPLLNMKPHHVGWSALQAVNHIYLAERLSIQYVQYKLAKGDAFPVIRPDAWLRSMVLKWILWSPLKFKSPKPIDMRGDHFEVLSVAELRENWDALRRELTQLLETHEPSLRWRLSYKQPYAGRLTLKQMLVFFRDHLRHHDRQIRKIVRSVGNGAG